jgi:8-oxo-dGTP diphosphatase
MHCPSCGTALQIFKNPTPTVDIIIETEGGFVLIKRKNPPYGWALPGGFVDYGESFEDAARREAAEETGLAVTLRLQFHTYSDPKRDARQHTASTVFIATATGHPVAADDASQAEIFHRGNLPPLVFDHERILQNYFAFKDTGKLPQIDQSAP